MERCGITYKFNGDRAIVVEKDILSDNYWCIGANKANAEIEAITREGGFRFEYKVGLQKGNAGLSSRLVSGAMILL